jgi:hypothetical protein
MGGRRLEDDAGRGGESPCWQSVIVSSWQPGPSSASPVSLHHAASTIPSPWPPSALLLRLRHEAAELGDDPRALAGWARRPSLLAVRDRHHDLKRLLALLAEEFVARHIRPLFSWSPCYSIDTLGPARPHGFRPCTNATPRCPVGPISTESNRASRSIARRRSAWSHPVRRRKTQRR